MTKNCKDQTLPSPQKIFFAIKSFLSIAIVSILCLLISPEVRAHEIRPAVADLTILDTDTPQLQIIIDFNAELFLSGLDASSVRDTDDAPEGQSYDQFRQLSSSDLAAKFTAAWPDFEATLTGLEGDSILGFKLNQFTVSENPATSLPRSSKLQISATLDDIKNPVQFGWGKRMGPLVLRQQADGIDPAQLYTAYLAPGSLSEPITAKGINPKNGIYVFFDYVKLGFIHIIPRGFDHILFVLGLFFFAARWRPLLAQVTLFTVAHTITLALATVGIVTISAAIIEPLIAASIVYVAVENLRGRQLHPSRLAVVFGFGLLHGLGFASVLSDLGLPPNQFILSLISFNIGVEVGQLAVLLPVYLVFGLISGDGTWYRRVIAMPASCAIAGTGLWMLASRLIGV